MNGDTFDESGLYFKQPENLADFVRKFGTSRALKTFYNWDVNRAQGRQIRNSIIDPDNENALGIFYNAFMNQTQGGKVEGTLPRDLRRWSDQAVNLIPGIRDRELSERGDLIDWEAGIKGQNRLLVLATSPFN